MGLIKSSIVLNNRKDVKHCSELSISYLRTHQAWERDEANAANAKQNNCEKCYYIDIFYFLEAALLGNFRVTFIRLSYYETASRLACPCS